MVEVAREFAKDVDYSNVRREDVPMIRDIIQGLVTFEATMPKLWIDIYDSGDHYIISAKGYNKAIPFARWYEKFEGPERDYEFVIASFITPAPDSVVMINVRKRNFNASHTSTSTTKKHRKKKHTK